MNNSNKSKTTQPLKNIRIFSTRVTINAKNYSGWPSWIPCTIVKVSSLLSYHVEAENGIEIHRHADQLRQRSL